MDIFLDVLVYGDSNALDNFVLFVLGYAFVCKCLLSLFLFYFFIFLCFCLFSILL
jgi:hypothetical protein